MAMKLACDRYGTTKNVQDVLITVATSSGSGEEWTRKAVLCPRAVEALTKRIELSCSPTPESKNGSSEA